MEISFSLMKMKEILTFEPKLRLLSTDPWRQFDCWFFLRCCIKRLVLVNFTIVKLLIFTFFKKDFVNIFHLDIPVWTLLTWLYFSHPQFFLQTKTKCLICLLFCFVTFCLTWQTITSNEKSQIKGKVFSCSGSSLPSVHCSVIISDQWNVLFELSEPWDQCGSSVVFSVSSLCHSR